MIAFDGGDHDFPAELVERCAKAAYEKWFGEDSSWVVQDNKYQDDWRDETRAVLLESGHADLVAALRGLDAYWTESFPGGPGDPTNTADEFTRSIGGRLSEKTIQVWRGIRAALAKAGAL